VLRRPAERRLERAQRGEQRRGLELREHARDRVDKVRLRDRPQGA
jgi:hypothetical protein